MRNELPIPGNHRPANIEKSERGTGCLRVITHGAQRSAARRSAGWFQGAKPTEAPGFGNVVPS